jgi:hypothetical protein
MLTIITPCCRPENLSKLYDSIHFDKVHKWIIVYDTSKDRMYDKLYEGNPKIQELESNTGISGNPQRNLALSLVEDGFIYFLDDDNIIHPNFWNIFDSFEPEKFYTFDQQRGNTILFGNRIQLDHIDTAMIIVHKTHVDNLRWEEDKYNADGIFIVELYNKNKFLHMYINTIASYYNYLR